jgi:soluble lytic murein transglycosylase-like protein
MRRGGQIVLILIMAWLSVILFAVLVREPTPRRAPLPAGKNHPAPVASKVAPGFAIAPPAPQAESAPAAVDLNAAALTHTKADSKRAGSTWQAPAQVAPIIKKKKLEEVVERYAKRYGVDEDLIWAVIRQESDFNPVAVSPKGAMGLMQLMPGTATLMGVSNPFDVEQNIAGGVKYLEQCLNQFDQDVPLALAAYNAGPANVEKYRGCPPFAETRQYVASILQAYTGEPIRADLKLGRVNYMVGGDPHASVFFRGLPWKIPLPRWKITPPQNKLSSPHWKMVLQPF